MSNRPLINLDANATTQPLPEVREAMDRAWRDHYGNPGSRHALGRRARQALEDARERIAAILDAAPSEVVFTSGGTEASNLALLGLTAHRTGSFAVPPGEHPATEETLRDLELRGWRRHVLSVGSDGRIDWSSAANLPWSEIRLATLLLAHNETGTIQDTAPLAALCRAHSIPWHVDAVQAVGKITVNFRELGSTTLALGGHKFQGPRGVGALLVREGVTLAPVAFGGHQEQGRRPGTECVALIVGMAAALDLWQRDCDAITQTLSALRDRLEAGLAAVCGPVVINGCKSHRLPNTSSIAFPGCDGEALLVALDLAGVCCSLGSTCASGSAEPAPILVAMNCPPDVQRSTLRLSLTRQTTTAEIEEAIRCIAAVVNGLRRR